jgi:hypothetical protein
MLALEDWMSGCELAAYETAELVAYERTAELDLDLEAPAR